MGNGRVQTGYLIPVHFGPQRSHGISGGHAAGQHGRGGVWAEVKTCSGVHDWGGGPWDFGDRSKNVSLDRPLGRRAWFFRLGGKPCVCLPKRDILVVKCRTGAMELRHWGVPSVDGGFCDGVGVHHVQIGKVVSQAIGHGTEWVCRTSEYYE